MNRAAAALFSIGWVSLPVFCSTTFARPTLHSQRQTSDLVAPWLEARIQRSTAFRVNVGASTTARPENQARCLGPQPLLVIRVDFSDLAGEPVAAAMAQHVLDDQVKPFLERNSYGKTTIVSSVSTKVYRMPRTAAAYMTTEPDDGYGDMSRQLWLDAVEAARTDYPVDDFSRIAISYSSELGKQFDHPKWDARGGLAILSDAKMWVGDFTFAVVAHELCHTYGAQHSNRWTGRASDPVGFGGHIEEYQDPTDLMGRGPTPDCDLSPWQKFLCGWLPESAIAAVSASGTYRVYRFDVADADLNRPVLLQFSQDGIHYYSIALRGGLNASSGQDLAATATGAYVGFTYFGNDPFNLVDLAPPYDDAREVALAVGSTLNDTAAGLTMKAVGRGGSGRDSYLDVEITFTRPSRLSFVGWGLHDAFESAFEPHEPIAAAVAVAGFSHTTALRKDGSVWAGPEDGLNAKTLPGGLTDVVAVAAGNRVSGAVRQDGTVALWGSSDHGLTAPPPNLGEVTALQFGRRHALALKSDGTVVMWGAQGNESASLDGAGELPGDLRNVVAIAAGDYFSLALKRDGTVVGTDWEGNRVHREYNDLTAIACGAYCGLGLRANGTPVLLFSCNSTYGQTEIPPGLADIKAIAVGVSHCLALRADGSLISWGGKSGSGTRPFHVMQMKPPPGIRLRSVSAGYFHSVGIAESVGAPVINQSASRSGGRVHLSWSLGAGAARYLVDLSPLPTFATFLRGWQKLDVGNVTSAEIAALDPAATYYYRVHSVSATGETSFSNVGIIAPATAVAISAPQNQAPNVGAAATLSVTVSAGSSCRWYRDGDFVSDAVTSTLTLENVQPAAAGLYVAEAVDGVGQSVSEPAVVGVRSDRKVIGSGQELLPVDIRHPNGNVFDQVLLTGRAEAITADDVQNQITRTSFVDLDGDIVQVEFSGPGTLSIVLDNPSGPAVAEKYNQSSISYMKGHARIVIAGADERTNVSVFTVGRATAVDQSLFKDTASYDGIADIAFIAISSPSGRFGGIRAANAQFFASKGVTGVYAPGVQFIGPVYLGDISAYDTARPMIVLGAASEVRITGGDMLQDNGQPVRVSGVRQLRFTPGGDSHGNSLPARSNDAIYRDSGIDVTTQIVVNP